MRFDFQRLQDRVAAFQQDRFPAQPLEGKLAHLVREAKELHDNPSDLSEWADVVILIFGAAAQAGLDTVELGNAALAKLTICESRQWGPADSEGVHHHL